MEKDLIVLGISIREYIPYILIIAVGMLAGILFVLRTINDRALDTTSRKIQYVIYGIGSSMLITWIAYELLHYFTGFPLPLCSALAGGVGFIGAETAARLAIELVESKFGLSKKNQNH